ncbi:hypothetical protein BJY52DRAFT_1337920 [Lactarius psammicola]|nr:hypothetical protein BJY52DRAFT_1337920 [Lactarius psammicola]
MLHSPFYTILPAPAGPTPHPHFVWRLFLLPRIWCTMPPSTRALRYSGREGAGAGSHLFEIHVAWCRRVLSARR